MGYHPDPMLSALSHYRLTRKERPMQATMAWFNTLREPDKLRQYEEFDLYWQGAEALAKKLGFHLEEFRTEELSLKRMDDIFKARSIRGILLAPTGLPTTPLEWNEFPWQDYAVVRFGRSLRTPMVNIVTSAQVTNTMLAFEKIYHKGYRRIGFVGNISLRRLFSAGYLRAQQSLPSKLQLSALYYDGGPNQSDAALDLDALEKWMNKEKPDAIITANTLMVGMLQQLGYSVPKDVGIATTSIHDTPIDAGIDQNPVEIGRAAVRTLNSLLNEHHFGMPDIAHQILVEGRWVDGSMLPDRN